MNLFAHFGAVVKAALGELTEVGILPKDIDLSRVTIESPRDAAHGDITTNAAMVLAKSARRQPRELAGRLADLLVRDADIETAHAAGPGFVNIELAAAFWPKLANSVLALGQGYGSSKMGAGEKVNIEYVSANPTGPLHMGNCRGAVFGDALANLLKVTGYEVNREYFIKDVGAQVDILAKSALLRYREALGEEIGDIPDGLHPGEYLKPVGAALAAEHGDALLSGVEADWLPIVRGKSISMMMDLIRDDLVALNVHPEFFVSERALHGESGQGVQVVLQGLRERGFTQTIYVLDAGHSGYVTSFEAAMDAVSGGKARAVVKICQLVSLVRGGRPVNMSKQGGNFVALRDVVDEVGPDGVRFMMLFGNNETPLDFDCEKVTEQSRDNPVFYVQYAHARICSVLRDADAFLGETEVSIEKLSGCDFKYLDDSGEIAVLRKIGNYPNMLEIAAAKHEPHRIAFYLYELAGDFHELWNKGKESPQLRFIVKERMHVTLTRLAFLRVIRYVLGNGLRILGVNPVEEM